MYPKAIILFTQNMFENFLTKKTNILLLIISFSFLSCEKNESNTNKPNSIETPSSKIPDDLKVGTWFTGTISPISYFDRDGHHLGSEYEAGREFQFYEDENGKGRIKFWQYLGLRQSNRCITEIYTTKEGTVVFEDEKFTFYPTKGNFRTTKSQCASGNETTNRAAQGEDLSPTTYRYELKGIDGVIYLYTYKEDDVSFENPLFVYTSTE